MQFEEGPPGTRVPLPRPSIDTGMGLERFAAILQGKHDNYDTDTLRALILASAEATGQDPDGPFTRQPPGHRRPSAQLGVPDRRRRAAVERRPRLRAAPDHAPRHAPRAHDGRARAGDVPAGAGAGAPDGRRLSRTGARRGADRRDAAAGGDALQADCWSAACICWPRRRRGSATASRCPARVAFRLYDTYGFPLDLTQDALREQGRDGGPRRLRGGDGRAARARPRRLGRLRRGGDRTRLVRAEGEGRRDRVPRLLDRDARRREILALVVNGAPVDEAAAGTEVAVVLNQTPFYGESGGQVGDTGVITGADGLRIAVTDTQKKLGDLFVHLGRVEAGEARVGAPVVAEVDHARRTAIRAHHSATHLLHEALRRRLGTHVTQKGSLNAPDRLRFDVCSRARSRRTNWPGSRREVNARIRENSEVTTRLMTPDAAVEMGAMAL